MCHFSLPHVNVLSKIDMIEQNGKLAFPLSFYTDLHDLSYLTHAMNEQFSIHTPYMKENKYMKLNEAVCELISDYNLVSFVTLNVGDVKSMQKLLKLIDKSNGYVFVGKEKQAYTYSHACTYIHIHALIHAHIHKHTHTHTHTRTHMHIHIYILTVVLTLSVAFCFFYA